MPWHSPRQCRAQAQDLPDAACRLLDLILKLLQRAQKDGRLDADEDLIVLRAMSHTYIFAVIAKMMVGVLVRWTPGASEHEALRAAVLAFSRKLFKHDASSSDAMPVQGGSSSRRRRV